MQFGPESLLPPLVAITLAILTRRVVVPLGLGVLIGAALLAGASPRSIWLETPRIFVDRLWDSLSDASHLKVVAFTLLLGAMVGVLEAAGSMRHLIHLISRRIHSRRGAQSMIAASGLVIFFDDYANSLLVGGTMRAPADRFGVSREKLAYLVDSTAAPVAGLSLISTWAAIEIDYIANGLADAGITSSSAAMTMFIQSIPYRFYAWFALVTVAVVVITGRDVGSMRRAERAARGSSIDVNRAANEIVSESAFAATRFLWAAAVMPILGCVAAVVVTLIVSGIESVGDVNFAAAPLAWSIAVLGAGDPYLALIVGSGIGLSVAWIAHRSLGKTEFRELANYSLRGAAHMWPAIVILWFAWALSALTEKDQLNTGGFLAGLLSERIAATVLPTLVFAIAGFVAFATGTSWGTMAILTPLSIELSFRLTSADPSNPVVLATCGAVLAGAILGDHCSPISDTTVLSSRASGCDHVSHVRTQMPYAILAGGVAMICGTFPASLGISPWIGLLAGTVLIFAVIRWFGMTVPNSVA